MRKSECYNNPSKRDAMYLRTLFCRDRELQKFPLTSLPLTVLSIVQASNKHTYYGMLCWVPLGHHFRPSSITPLSAAAAATRPGSVLASLAQEQNFSLCASHCLPCKSFSATSGMEHLWKPAQYLYRPGFNQRRAIRRFYRYFHLFQGFGLVDAG